MVSKPVCMVCRQIPRHRLHQVPDIRGSCQAIACLNAPSIRRPFSTHHSLSAVQAKPQPYATKEPPPPKSSAISKSSGAVLPEDHQPPPSAVDSVAEVLRKQAPSVTETYVAYGVCEKLVKECARQADYTIPQAHEKNVEIPKTKDGEDLGVGTGWWFEALHLTPTFNTWAQITFLHMYLLTVRLRTFHPSHAPTWHQHLLDHFFYIAEDRMVTTHNMAARSVRNKYLKDLFVQWRGLLAAYDEGLVRGDAVLATAVWRNVFKAEEGVDWRGVGEIVSYVRGVLSGLEGMGDEEVAGGEVVFGSPEGEREGVLVRSRLMEKPGELAAGTERAGGRAKTLSDPSDVV